MQAEKTDLASEPPIVLVAGDWGAGGTPGPIVAHGAVLHLTSLNNVAGKVLQLHPDWCLLDVSEDQPACAALVLVHSLRPELSVGALGPASDPDLAEVWMRRGARVYLGLDSTPEEVAGFLNASTGLNAVVVDGRVQEAALADQVAAVPGLMDGSVRLSGREVETIRRVRRGLATAEIARELGLTPRAVESHLTHLYNKLGASNRVDLVNRTRQV
ncbi:MAG: hypothetical protein GEU28_09485 [Dehalococcoidia bacterium]|nr:hypothetical protein [Dehalococcoidia bacterium]